MYISLSTVRGKGIFTGEIYSMGSCIRNAYRILKGKSVGKGPLETLSWEGNSEMDSRKAVVMRIRLNWLKVGSSGEILCIVE